MRSVTRNRGRLRGTLNKRDRGPPIRHLGPVGCADGTQAQPNGGMAPGSLNFNDTDVEKKELFWLKLKIKIQEVWLPLNTCCQVEAKQEVMQYRNHGAG